MALVNLILLEDVENLGLAGETVNVAPGYARNFLLPRKLATKASAGALRVIEARKEQIEAQRKKELAKAEALAEQVARAEVSISMQATEDDQLFGSVTERMVADNLAAQGIVVPHSAIRMSEHIKTLGATDVTIKLHKDVSLTLKVWVVKEA